MTNKFQARGISKETGKFVYGYPLLDERVNQWLIIKLEEKSLKGLNKTISMHKQIKITKEPDRSTLTKDRKGNTVYENDIVIFADEEEWGGKSEEWVVSYDEKQGEWSIGGGTTQETHIYKEIIGNTHNIKEKDEK
jgi:hypothetical protein